MSIYGPRRPVAIFPPAESMGLGSAGSQGLAMEANEGSAVIEETTYRTQARTEAAPRVSPDGSRLLARRPGRELFPASWLRHRARIAYDNGTPKGGDLSGVLLEWCGAGLIVQANGSKSLLPWERVVVVELLEEGG